MKHKFLFTLLILSMLLAACSGGKKAATVEPTVAAPQATKPMTPTLAPSPTAEQPAPVPPPEEDLLMLRANPWQWVSFTNPMEQYAIDNPQNYVVTFNNDATVNIVADCNNANASQVIAGSSLTIQIGPMTMAACPEGSHSDDFIKYLGSAAGYFFENGHLFIDLMADGGTMQFAPKEAETAESGESTQAGNLPRFEPLDECFVTQPDDVKLELDMDCGYVVVPESRTGESTREIKLAITRFNTGEENTNSPLFMFAGGPGKTNMSTQRYSLLQQEVLGEILKTRDIVLVEQRGTEFSQPFLDCPAVYSAAWTGFEKAMTPEEYSQYNQGLIEKCINDFKEQGVNFDAYNSVENAADVNAVREALGYDKIIYYGASYGSQLGQHVMRDFPEILEAVVLDGASALSRKSWIEDRALDAQWAQDNLIKLCTENQKCKDTYDIQALLDGAMALFKDGPIPYSYADPNDPNLTIEGEITLNSFVSIIHSLQGDKFGIASLPNLLLMINQGGAELVKGLFGDQSAKAILASRDATKGDMAYLQHAAMVCSDDPVKSADEVKLEGAGEYARIFGQDAAAGYVFLCQLMNVSELPDATDVNVTTDVPTLLLTGNLDVETPVFHSQRVADSLPNARLITFNGTSHVQIASANFCAAKILTQFVQNPTSELDLSCVEESSMLDFSYPEN